MSNSNSNKSTNEGIEDSYNFEAPMYCPYCSMPYVRSTQEEYAPPEPCDEYLDNSSYPLYRHRGRRRHRRRRHRRGFPLWPLIFFYDDWYWW